MFCINCGNFIEEGKAFCRYCGAPVYRSPEEATSGAQETGGEVLDQVGGAAGPPTWTAPPTWVVPPASAGPAVTAAPPKSKTRGGLIAGIVAAAIVVLAGVGAGVYFGFFWGSGEGQLVESGSTTALPNATSAGLNTTSLATETTAVGGGVTQTVPTLPSSTSLPPSTVTTLAPTTTGTMTTTTEDPVEVYLATAGMLAAHVEICDVRIPELAEVINRTLPNVPHTVTDELTEMLNQLKQLRDDLAVVAIPRPFEEADYWLREAAKHMALRIDATIQGVETARAAGKVTAKANAFFDQGRKERDAYRAAMPKYYQNLPLE